MIISETTGVDRAHFAIADHRSVKPSQTCASNIEGIDRSMDPEAATLSDVNEAEDGPRALSDENADGLVDGDEEIRRQTED